MNKNEINTDDANPTTEETSSTNIMSVRDIKNELQKMGISFQDCFDKESLTQRLLDAQSGKVTAAPDNNHKPSTPQTKKSNPNFNMKAKATELRSKKVRELRTLCATNNIPWAHMIEKEELVLALLQHFEQASLFSPSGKLMPGKVTTIDEDTLSKELAPGATTTPLLLDVYADWCGPCKMMAPLLEEAASELGDKVRVAKMDSDQNPGWSSKLAVRALPTILVFDGKTGKQIERVEGALQKAQILQLVKKHI